MGLLRLAGPGGAGHKGPDVQTRKSTCTLTSRPTAPRKSRVYSDVGKLVG